MAYKVVLTVDVPRDKEMPSYARYKGWTIGSGEAQKMIEMGQVELLATSDEQNYTRHCYIEAPGMVTGFKKKGTNPWNLYFTLKKLFG